MNLEYELNEDIWEAHDIPVRLTWDACLRLTDLLVCRRYYNAKGSLLRYYLPRAKRNRKERERREQRARKRRKQRNERFKNAFIQQAGSVAVDVMYPIQLDVYPIPLLLT
jgi:hypothetical protein